MQSTTTIIDAGNGQKTRETVIGTVTLTEPLVRRTSEQTACNYYEVTIPAGTYDVVSRADTRYGVYVKYEGLVTDEHFVNRLFHASSIAEKRSIGKPMRNWAMWYTYLAAEQFATADGWELADDWKVEMQFRTYSDGGKPRRSWSIIGPEGERL